MINIGNKNFWMIALLRVHKCDKKKENFYFLIILLLFVFYVKKIIFFIKINPLNIH